jgi:hypothetical protein
MTGGERIVADVTAKLLGEFYPGQPVRSKLAPDRWRGVVHGVVHGVTTDKPILLLIRADKDASPTAAWYPAEYFDPL